MLLAVLASLALALEIGPEARWVEGVGVSLGGADAALAAGLVFPVVDGDDVVGFVFVGDASFEVPVGGPGDALAIGAMGGSPAQAGADWRTTVDRLVVVSQDDAVRAVTEAGHPVERDPKNVVYLDASGRETVVVTKLAPRAALDDAKDALRSRSLVLGQVGLSPTELLRREEWRAGPRRIVAEARPTERLALGLDPLNTLAATETPWLTWAVDPAGLVDDAWASVLGVHWPTGDGRVWRPLTGVPHAAPPEVQALAAQANVVVLPGEGVGASGQVELRLVLEVAPGTRAVDLFVPDDLTAAEEGRLGVLGAPKLGPVTADGGATELVTSRFGPRSPGPGWVPVTVLLPKPASGRVTLGLSWSEEWDVGNVLQVTPWVLGQFPEHPPPPMAYFQDLPAVISLGHVLAGHHVLPWLATGRRDYPAEVRGGAFGKRWAVSVGAGAVGAPMDDGRLWRAPTTSIATISAGELTERVAPKAAGLPGVRVLAHQLADDSLPERIRAILAFYDRALPPYPFPEVVVVQGPSTPTLVTDRSRVGATRPGDSMVQVEAPGVRAAGAGQLVLSGLSEIRFLPPLGRTGYTSASRVEEVAPHAVDRGLAEGLATGWWEDLGWADRDRWLAGALAATYRDLFVRAAYGPEALATWRARTDELLRDATPKGRRAPLAFEGADWAREAGARLLGGAARERLGEPALLEGLDRFLAAGDPTTDRLGRELGPVVAAWLDHFAVAGLRPDVDGSWAIEGGTLTIALRSEPAVDVEVPVAWSGPAGSGVVWVPLVGGAGRVAVPDPGAERVEVDPEGWLPLAGRELQRR